MYETADADQLMMPVQLQCSVTQTLNAEVMLHFGTIQIFSTTRWYK